MKRWQERDVTRPWAMHWLGLALCWFMACGSEKKDAYEALAKQANPILQAMRPAAARLLALDPADHNAIIAACMSADEELWKLRDVKFDNEYVDTLPKSERVSSTAAGLLDDRKLECRDLPPYRIAPCAEWCRSEWTYMIDIVERVHEAAKREGVDFVSLKP